MNNNINKYHIDNSLRCCKKRHQRRYDLIQRNRFEREKDKMQADQAKLAKKKEVAR